ncbi:hypothetical protein ES708_20905 [subsurface metagenome]
MTHVTACLQSILGPRGACQVELERTGGDLAVSGVNGEEPGEGKNFPGTPRTNSRAFVQREASPLSERGLFY